MTQHQTATYLRYGVDTTQTQLGDKDIKNIFTTMCSGHLNWENERLRKQLLSVRRDYPSGRYLKSFLGSIIDRRYSIVSPIFWRERGFDEETAKLRASEYQVARKRPLNVSYWQDQGYSRENAEHQVGLEQSRRVRKMYDSRNADFRRAKSPRSITYWLTRGYSQEDAEQKLSDIATEHSRQMKGRACWVPVERRNTHLAFYIALGMTEVEARIALRKRQSTRHSSEEKQKEYRTYYCECWWHTRRVMSSVPDIERRSRDYHLDHRYSIYDGFNDKIDPRIIGSLVNLRIIPAEINLQKQRHSDITKEDLLYAYHRMAI